MLEISVIPVLNGKVLTEQAENFSELHVTQALELIEKLRSAKYGDNTCVYGGVTVISTTWQSQQDEKPYTNVCRIKF